MSEFKQQVEAMRPAWERNKEALRQKQEATPFALTLFDVIEAYLAEHPADDDVPADADWLESIGLHDESWHRDAKRYPIEFGVFVRIVACVVGWSSAEVYAGDGTLTRNATRGDVRRLCQCLGVELTGAGK